MTICSRCYHEFPNQLKPNGKPLRTCQRCRDYAKITRERFPDRVQQWRIANPEIKKAYDKEYYRNNRELEIARVTKLHKANPEPPRAATRRYHARHKNKILDNRRANPESHRMTEHKRRNHLKCDSPATPLELRELINAQDNRCFYCGSTLSADKSKNHIEHIIAPSKGGTNDIYNIVWSCAGCNNGVGGKGTKDAVVFIKELKELGKIDEETAARRILMVNFNRLYQVNSLLLGGDILWLAH